MWATRAATSRVTDVTSYAEFAANRRLLLQLGIRTVGVVDELLVQGQRLLVHEPLTAAVALDRGIQLQADVLDAAIAALRQRVLSDHFVRAFEVTSHKCL